MSKLTRNNIAEIICDHISDYIIEFELRSGWPSEVHCTVDDQDISLLMHVGKIGLGGRGDDHRERRFQNPGKNKPLERRSGFKSLLIGLWNEDKYIKVTKPLLVIMESTEKRFDSITRQSYFISRDRLLECIDVGIVEYETEVEKIIIIWPELLPSFLKGFVSQHVNQNSLQDMFDGYFGHLSNLNERDRSYTKISRAVRDRRFSKMVKDAYNHTCALCSFDIDILEAAHIYPVSAKSSTDTVCNGICLCPNHHRVFDRHLLWINPVSFEVQFHQVCSLNPTFINSTNRKLRTPENPSLVPKESNFNKRYNFHEDNYTWVNS